MGVLSLSLSISQIFAASLSRPLLQFDFDFDSLSLSLFCFNDLYLLACSPGNPDLTVNIIIAFALLSPQLLFFFCWFFKLENEDWVERLGLGYGLHCPFNSYCVTFGAPNAAHNKKLGQLVLHEILQAQLAFLRFGPILRPSSNFFHILLLSQLVEAQYKMKLNFKKY